MPISVCIYIYVAHMAFCMFIQYGSELRMRVIKTLNIGNNQLMIVCAFLYTKTCSFRGSHTHMHYHFCGSKWHKRYSLPFSRTCFGVVKAGAILGPAPATGHRGQRYDPSRTHASLLLNASMLIMIQKHNMHAYLKRWWNPFYFNGCCL